MPEQWMNPVTWSGAQWLVMAILVLVVLAMAVVIHRLIGVVQSEMKRTRERRRPNLRPSLHPDSGPAREENAGGDEIVDEGGEQPSADRRQ